MVFKLGLDGLTIMRFWPNHGVNKCTVQSALARKRLTKKGARRVTFIPFQYYFHTCQILQWWSYDTCHQRRQGRIGQDDARHSPRRPAIDERARRALIDADEQGSAMDFTRQRQQRMKMDRTPAIQTREADVAVQVGQMAQKYDDIIIDVGRRDTASQRAALAVAQTLLIPFSPTSVGSLDRRHCCGAPQRCAAL